MLLSLSEEKFQFILGVVNVSFNLCWSPVFHPSILPAFTKKKLKKQLLYSKIPTIKLIWVYVHTNPLRQPRHKVCYESDCILNGLNPEHSHIPHPGISSFLSHLFNCYIPTPFHCTIALHFLHRQQLILRFSQHRRLKQDRMGMFSSIEEGETCVKDYATRAGTLMRTVPMDSILAQSCPKHPNQGRRQTALRCMKQWHPWTSTSAGFLVVFFVCRFGPFSFFLVIESLGHLQIWVKSIVWGMLIVWFSSWVLQRQPTHTLGTRMWVLYTQSLSLVRRSQL